MPAELEQILLFLQQYRLVSAFKNMPSFSVTSIVSLSIYAVELFHTERQIGIRRLDHEMVMILRQAVGMTEPVIAFDDRSKDREKNISVLIVSEYPATSVAARSYVINCVGEFYA